MGFHLHMVYRMAMGKGLSDGVNGTIMHGKHPAELSLTGGSKPNG